MQTPWPEGIEIGGSFSHYRILSKIGESGMGEVYLAQESQLDRKNDPVWDPVRSDPRFADLLRRMGTPQ